MRRSHSVVRMLMGTVITVIVIAAMLVAPRASAATDPCAGLSAVACENLKPGAPRSEWDGQNGAGDPSIQGFATDMSVNRGQRVGFKIDTNASAYTVGIYRLGWYSGPNHGARRVATISPSTALPQRQPTCLTQAATNLVDCGNWGLSAFWDVPADAVSGIYLAVLKRTDTGGQSQITFVVRDDLSTSDLVFQTADTTWQAYNTYGGANFYGGVNGRAMKLSYNRPFSTRSGTTERDFLFANEFPMLLFLERNGYDLSYISGIDTDRAGALLRNHRTFLSVGHDEYWSGRQRTNVEGARDAGVNLAFFSGNDVYWKTRWEPSIDGTNTANRTLVCYKETWDNAATDPSSAWTGTWRDPRFSPPKDGGRPENALIGTAYMSNNTDLPITVSAAEGKQRIWRNTAAATQSTGGSLQLAPHTVGYESNEDLDNGFRPAGLIRMSTTTGDAPEYLQDFGNTTAPGTTTHHITMYKAASGAKVFSAGTIRWSWGLSDDHDILGPSPSAVMQQATINLLADQAAQPTTLMAGMVAASAPSDTAGPTATITSPAAGASIANGTKVTATGTATDSGGVVAGVEVSTDGGSTWHPAGGTTAWTYTYIQSGSGAVDLRVRATDDSLNTGAVTTRSVTVSCPCSLFGAQTPKKTDSGDSSAVELGVRFSPNVSGEVTGVRFYKSSANTGTHTGTLWSSTGTQLATGTFTGETATGWQTLRFDAPVPVSATTEYVVSYFAPNGRYSADANYFTARSQTSPPLTAPAATASAGQGVFAGSHRFPTNSYGNTNYWVDVLFDDRDLTAPTVGGLQPVSNSTSVAPTVAPSAVFSEPVDPASVRMSVTPAGGTAVAGSTGYDAATRRATFTPGAALDRGATYTASVRGTDLAGNAMAAPVTWSFKIAVTDPVPGQCPCSIWKDSDAPATPSVSDAANVELGVRFTADVDGQIDGVKFYKGPQNTGTHTGSLWTPSGQLLASATFTGETSSGWQTVMFTAPVAVTAGTTYVASYRAPQGGYSATSAGLASAVDSPPLHATGGAYLYGGGFPSQSSSTNYWVDVVYDATDVAPTVNRTSPGKDATSVNPSAAISATLDGFVRSGSAKVTLTGPSGDVSGTTSWDATARTVTLTPAAALAQGVTYTATVSGATSFSGQVMTPRSWSFRVVGPNACPCGLFDSTARPAIIDAGDAKAVTLGTRFSTTIPGYVTGVRFYKASTNTGTHTGYLWDDTGAQVATVTFTNETASGWQSARFAQPVQLTVGRTYTIGYHAPNGNYSATGAFFASPWDNVVLTAPVAAGVYSYGAPERPTSSYNNGNYWVDAVFATGTAPDTTPPTVAASTPVDGATSVPVDAPLTATFDEAIDPATLQATLTRSGTTVSGATAYDNTAKRVTFTPSASLARGTGYALSVKATDTSGNAMAASTTIGFTTVKPDPTPGVCPCGLWTDATQPNVLAASDAKSVEVGMAFSPDTDGRVTGVRFFKAPTNTGTHTGSLWSAGGQRLATATFTQESASGWQTVIFATPVQVTAGSTYTVSYQAPNGRYSYTLGALGTARDVPPLHSPAQAGRYVYGTGWPGQVVGTSYLVDVVFDR